MVSILGFNLRASRNRGHFAPTLKISLFFILHLFGFLGANKFRWLSNDDDDKDDYDDSLIHHEQFRASNFIRFIIILSYHIIISYQIIDLYRLSDIKFYQKLFAQTVLTLPSRARVKHAINTTSVQ